MKKKVVALVCCRENSKGVPKKNIKIFNGKPLIYWTYRNIVKSNLFDKIYLSTDGQKISNIAKKIGFDVPHLRPKRLASSTSDVFDTHDFFFKQVGINDNDNLVCIINNNPFITNKIIIKSFQKFKKNKFKSIVMGAIQIESDQIYFRQMKKKKNLLFPKFKNELINSKINRKKHNIFYNIGDIRWGKPSWLINFKKFNQKISKSGFKFIEINKFKYNDINTLDDWKESLRKFKNL